MPNSQSNDVTMNQIEQALYGAKNWNDWKYNIKHNYENVTENQLDSLFNYWD